MLIEPKKQFFLVDIQFYMLYFFQPSLFPDFPGSLKMKQYNFTLAKSK